MKINIINGVRGLYVIERSSEGVGGGKYLTGGGWGGGGGGGVDVVPTSLEMSGAIRPKELASWRSNHFMRCIHMLCERRVTQVGRRSLPSGRMRLKSLDKGTSLDRMLYTPSQNVCWMEAIDRGGDGDSLRSKCLLASGRVGRVKE